MVQSFFSALQGYAPIFALGPEYIDEIPDPSVVQLQRRRAIEGKLAQHIGKGRGMHHGCYGAFTGTTLMLLNGEPLISFVLTTV